MLTAGLPKYLSQGRRLIEAAALVDPARLADVGVGVREAAIDASAGV